MQVHPTKDPNLAIDMKELIERLQLRGLDLPILLRFNGILKDRLREIHDVFAQAINEHDYKGRYICVYPIKVNQQRHVVEQIVQLRQGRTASAWKPAASPRCWPSWR